MASFKTFSKAIHQQIDLLKAHSLFEVALDRDDLWQLYLTSFPEGSNPQYKERTEHDCNCCKNFIRDVGRMVAIKNGELITVWDVKAEGPYKVVADAMAKRVREAAIANIYTNALQKVGNEQTVQQLESGGVKQWNHFYGELRKEDVGITPTTLSEVSATVSVFLRGLEEITDDAIDTVLDLIDQNGLYRGQEFRASVVAFKALKKQYKALPGVVAKDRFVWSNYKDHSSRIRNTAIGTLLQDLSAVDGDTEGAVKSFEAKVAPTNYKRPTSLITKKMVEQAMTAIREDDLEPSLARRFATIEDVSVNDILFADRSVQRAMKGGSLEAALLGEVKEKPKDFSKVKEINIEAFIKKVLPGTTSIEAMLENGHESNLVSLIAPTHQNAASLFKWNNPFSWSYKGNVTDSIKERVKAAGGKVDGYMRVSLSWFNHDDLDLHVMEPASKKGVPGQHIHFRNRVNPVTGGNLDVDMNAGGGTSRSAVENICWPTKGKMLPGVYTVGVHNFAKRESIDVGFEVEVECNGEVYKFSCTKPVQNQTMVDVAMVHFDGTKIVEIIKASDNVDMGAVSKNIWGLDTNKLHKVSLLTLSPNHWHGSEDGNKHYIFVLDRCVNPERARGFYNEFLPNKYSKLRKVFEVLGDKTKCEHSDKQLSGLGFSSTKENAIVCKVAGETNGLLKITF